MKFDKLLEARTFRIVLWCLGGLIDALLIFKAGVVVGYRKAKFSYGWGENYHRNFGGPRGGFMRDGFKSPMDGGREFIDAHGVFGQIISATGTSLVIKGKDGVEKIVNIAQDTAVRFGRENVPATELHPSEIVVIVGEPNDQGQIDAKFIRIMPPPGRR